MRVVRRYPTDFKLDAIRLVERKDRSLKRVAEDLGIPHWTLRDWYRQSEMAKKRKPSGGASGSKIPEHESTEERLARLERENAALRRENEALKLDRAILKKAAAFFAKESE